MPVVAVALLLSAQATANIAPLELVIVATALLVDCKSLLDGTRWRTFRDALSHSGREQPACRVLALLCKAEPKLSRRTANVQNGSYRIGSHFDPQIHHHEWSRECVVRK